MTAAADDRRRPRRHQGPRWAWSWPRHGRRPGKRPTPDRGPRGGGARPSPSWSDELGRSRSASAWARRVRSTATAWWPAPRTWSAGRRRCRCGQLLRTATGLQARRRRQRRERGDLARRPTAPPPGGHDVCSASSWAPGSGAASCSTAGCGAAPAAWPARSATHCAGRVAGGAGAGSTVTSRPTPGRVGMEREARRRHDAGEETVLVDMAGERRMKSGVFAKALAQGDRVATELVDEAVDGRGRRHRQRRDAGRRHPW